MKKIYILEPVYPGTEKLKSRNLGARQIAKFVYTLLQMLDEKDIPENLPQPIIQQYHLINRYNAFKKIHFPESVNEYDKCIETFKI